MNYISKRYLLEERRATRASLRHSSFASHSSHRTPSIRQLFCRLFHHRHLLVDIRHYQKSGLFGSTLINYKMDSQLPRGTPPVDNDASQQEQPQQRIPPARRQSSSQGSQASDDSHTALEYGFSTFSVNRWTTINFLTHVFLSASFARRCNSRPMPARLYPMYVMGLSLSNLNSSLLLTS